MKKSEITTRLKAIEKAGLVKVFNFNFNKRMPKGAVGLPDYIILGIRSKVIFVEVKLKGDRMRAKQNDFKMFCQQYSIPYFILTETNIDDVINQILVIISER